MMGICYREQGAEFYNAFEHEIRGREGTGMIADLDQMLGSLRDGDASASSGIKSFSKPSLLTKRSSSFRSLLSGGAAKKTHKRAASSSPVKAIKKRRHSGDSDASSASSKGRRSTVRTGVITRGQRHQMNLRKRPNRMANHRIVKKSKRVSNYLHKIS